MNDLRSRAAVLLACGALVAGCGGGDAASSWAGTIEDSAGVAIVHNPETGVWGEGDAWSLVEELRIGGLDAPVESQFGQVLGIDLDAAGNIYVLDQQAQEVRVFSPEGAYLRTIGAPGAGPGELGLASVGAFVAGDELRVPDVSNMRVTRFALDGELIASTPLDLAKGIPIRWDELAGDRIVAQFRTIQGSGMTGMTSGDPVVTVGEATPDTLAILPQGETFQVSGGAAQFKIFDTEPLWDAGDDGTLLVARNSDYRIEVHDADGTLVRVVEKPSEPKPVTDSDKQLLLDAIRKLMLDQGAPPAAVQQLLQGMSIADVYPALGQVLVGPGGSLWVQKVKSAAEASSGEEFNPQDLGSDDWEVFDEAGRYLGVLTVPARFAPLRILGDAFWGVQRDELDVQSVVRFRLVRG